MVRLKLPRMDAFSPESLLRPQRIALIGASEAPDALGSLLTLQALNATGVTLYLVNRKGGTVMGQPVLTDVRELPDDLDLAVIMTPWSGVPGITKMLIRKRCRSAVVLSLVMAGGMLWGSRESQCRRLRNQLDGGSMWLLGPGSQGVQWPHLQLNLSVCPVMPQPGSIAFLSGSGAMANVLSDWLAVHGIGASLIASLGDGLGTSGAQMLDLLARDTQTRAVLVYLDQLPDARQWLSAARNLTAHKPLVVLLDPALTRNAAQETLLARALERAGALVADDLEEFCAAANVDLPAWPHAGARFAIMGNGPALSALAARSVVRQGASLAEFNPETEKQLRRLMPRAPIGNPLDLKREADSDRYRQAVEIVRLDPGVDVLLAIHHPNAFSSGLPVSRSLSASGNDQAPLLAAFAGAGQDAARRLLSERGVSAFPTPEAAVRAYLLNRRYFQLRASLRRTPSPWLESMQLDAPSARALRALQADQPNLARQILALLGISCGALQAASDGLQLGIYSDPMLGPFAQVEELGKLAKCSLPLNRLSAQELLEQISGPNAWRAQLLHLMLRCAAAFEADPTLAQLSLHGLHYRSDGELEAELRARKDPAAPGFAFAPVPFLPSELIEAKDGMRMQLRPIRGEDEPKLREGFTHLSPDEVRMRFMYPLKAMTHDLAARLTQLDYDREVAWVLSEFLPPGQAQIYGVVRASFDVLRKEAEFAIVIPSQLAGQGLGTRLLGDLIVEARERGMRTIFGSVLRENAPMLALARKLAFEETPETGQAGVVRVSLKL